jgi:hypothetical protein
MEKEYVVSEKILLGTLDYLYKKPYVEVSELIKGIRETSREYIAPPIVPETKAEPQVVTNEEKQEITE